uniref:LCP family protein n=1 Tax=Agathobacter sp. TaxID=2021311 RepID=UPI0040572C72
MRHKKNNVPVIIMFVVLAIVLIAVIVIAVNKNTDTPADTDKSETASDTQDAGRWQEGVIEHNGTYYKFNDKIHTYLIMGIDKDGKVESLEGTADGGQSDAMFLLVTNSEEETLSVISINRNSMTEITVYGEGNLEIGKTTAQICTQHGFGDGKKLSCNRTVDAVSRLFYSLPIDGYLSIHMGAIPIMNDAIGGTEVTVLQDLSYPDAGVELKKGETVNLMGMEAYYYLRGRDTNEFDSATYRLRRQEQYITAYFSKLKAVAAGSASKVLDVYESIEDYVVTNIDFVDLVSELMSYEYDESRMLTVPGETVMGEKFEEYHVDDEALYDMIIDVFYREAEVKE